MVGRWAGRWMDGGDLADIEPLQGSVVVFTSSLCLPLQIK